MTLWWEACYRDPQCETFGEPSAEIVELSKHLPKALAVLDAGCGDGRNLRFLSGAGHRVFGCDKSLAAISKTKARCKSVGTEAVAWVHDIRALWLQRQFDIVLCQGVLHFLVPDQRDQVVGQLQALTVSGGVNVISSFTSALPPPPDMAPFLLGLMPAGGVLEAYKTWEVMSHSTYTYCDWHGPSLRHEHAIEKLTARKPGTPVSSHPVVVI